MHLALEYSRVTLPECTEALYFFVNTPNIWGLPPERLRDALIAVGEVMSPAIEIVAANHVDTHTPALIEGDAILPSLWLRPRLRERARSHLVRGVFLVEPDEDAILANVLARARYGEGRTDEDLRTEARAKWQFGKWLAAEARRYGLPVVEPRPWGTLPDRILAAVGGPAG